MNVVNDLSLNKRVTLSEELKSVGLQLNAKVKEMRTLLRERKPRKLSSEQINVIDKKLASIGDEINKLQ